MGIDVTVLLDTHTLLWWTSAPKLLSPKVRKLLDGAGDRLVSAMSCWEISMLAASGRIVLSRPVSQWVTDLFASGAAFPAPVTPAIGVRAGSLGAAGFHGDPADRILWSTAAELGVPFLSKDDRIRKFGRVNHEVKVIW